METFGIHGRVSAFSNHRDVHDKPGQRAAVLCSAQNGTVQWRIPSIRPPVVRPGRLDCPGRVVCTTAERGEGAGSVDFEISKEHRRLQRRCRELAADFATRAAGHDRDASHPTENYQRLRDEGFLALNLAPE